MAFTLFRKQYQSYFAEMVCSFIFGFAVYSAIIASTITEQVATPIIVGLTVLLSSVVIIYTFNTITLAHFNPAITFSAILFRKIPIIKGLIYIIAQGLGFMIASGVVLGCFPGGSGNNLNIIRAKKASRAVSKGRIICTELFLTGILVFICFMVAINAYKKPKYLDKEENVEAPDPNYSWAAPLIIGFTLGFLALIGFGSSGGVFNPGLVWAPVLVTGKWHNSWCYWVGQFVGGPCGAFIQYFLLSREY